MGLLAPQVVEAFGELTGITYRVTPHGVMRQAADFVKHGFTLADLELVIAYTKRGIQRGDSGFNAQSLTWRVLFGEHGAPDEWQKFQERLGLAQEMMRRTGWRPKLMHGDNGRAQATTSPAGRVAATAAEQEQPASDEDRQATAARLKEFQKQMKGGGV